MTTDEQEDRYTELLEAEVQELEDKALKQALKLVDFWANKFDMTVEEAAKKHLAGLIFVAMVKNPTKPERHPAERYTTFLSSEDKPIPVSEALDKFVREVEVVHGFSIPIGPRMSFIDVLGSAVNAMIDAAVEQDREVRIQ